METFVRDVRASVRTLMKKPGFTVVVVLMLALGIAANTAIFSVVNGVLLRALPYREPARLAMVWRARPANRVNELRASIPQLEDWKSRSRSFQDMACSIRFNIPAAMTDPRGQTEEPDMVWHSLV